MGLRSFVRATLHDFWVGRKAEDLPRLALGRKDLASLLPGTMSVKTDFLTKRHVILKSGLFRAYSPVPRRPTFGADHRTERWSTVQAHIFHCQPFSLGVASQVSINRDVVPCIMAFFFVYLSNFVENY